MAFSRSMRMPPLACSIAIQDGPTVANSCACPRDIVARAAYVHAASGSKIKFLEGLPEA